MKRAIEKYVSHKRHLDILELGSGTSPGQRKTHRSLFDLVDHTYLGVDVQAGPTVDRVMPAPYTIPVRSNSQDIVVCGSVMEHIPLFWVSALEIARVLRPNGLLFVTVPSRGHKHSAVDCWRMYPDGLRAIGMWAGLIVLESHVHYPPMTSEKRHDYPAIDSTVHYWGDAVGVFRKPAKYSLMIRAYRPLLRACANRLAKDGPLGVTPVPRNACDILSYEGASNAPSGRPAVLRLSSR
jgi:SAM-dependent methyltransferase